VWAGEHGGEAVMVASANVPDMVELWDWILGPGDAHESEAHTPGTRELVHVLSGQVRVTLGEDETVGLAAGDAVSFPGDRPHGYSNPGRSKSRFALTVYEPVRRTADRARSTTLTVLVRPHRPSRALEDPPAASGPVKTRARNRSYANWARSCVASA
jgi:mannose-6-phosphate isomerase-like protein (cupin superfamily)